MLRILLPITCLLIVSCQKKDNDTETSQTTAAKETTPISLNSDLSHSTFKGALTAVNAQCPQEYPEVVTALPDAKNFGKISTTELMKMLESWNPSLRMEAAKALSDRGKGVLDVLKQGLNSDNWMVRAGSTTALATIIKQALSGLRGPDLETAKQEFTEIAAEFVRLIGDERLEVRVAALDGLNIAAPQTPAAAKAVLLLSDDPDDYLSQDAMIALAKNFTIDALEQDEVITAFRAALRRSLPNGKGAIVTLITRMKPETQQKFVPDLLHHLDWKPIRDTMFASGGQEDAIKLLTKMKEPQLIERLPKLMGKIKRGDGLFDLCLNSAKAYGKDAKVIVPQLRAILVDIEANGDKAQIRPNRDIEAGTKKLKETIQHLESL